MMSRRVVIDPITRIEGHLRIEVEIDENNVVQKAYSSSTLWRGIELILKGRDPRDAGLMAQRICGVCTYSHYKAGVEAVEDALGVTPPLNAQLVRSLLNESLYMHDHIVQFYHLHGLDWVDILSALEADPALAAKEAFKYTDLPIATGEDELKAVQEKVKGFSGKGSLGPFANAYWGNPTYKFTPEQNLIALSHYLKALEVQRIAAQMFAIFGAKQPHPQSLVVGGITSVKDMLSPARLAEWKSKYEIVKEFIDRAYYPDIVMAASAYGTEESVLGGMGVKNFLTGDAFLLSRNKNLFESGMIKNGDLSRVYPIEDQKIEEDVTHAWYEGDKPLQPYNGETIPNYTGFIDGDTVNGPAKIINEKDKYSWVKSPRYEGESCEVGPLASMLVNYAKGNKPVVDAVDTFLKRTGLPVEALFTTLGRTAARMLQTKVIADHAIITFNSLIENIKSDQSTYTKFEIDPALEYKGRFIGEVPRGTLSHWVRIKDGVIENYQAVVPTTWNAGPKDANDIIGPYEASLVGLKLEDPTKPLEVLRIIHSFDPCMACSVHVMDIKGKELADFKVSTVNGVGTC
ncbi:nickel-dependent hydrogenase large subunit [Sulfurovum sp. zt1-1]|uniref:Nickel-dependent hydrogenase large subunit n=1 Tax=Sulfurovum zhangzhouensis TaxID=3019067 RepID=A0ABT7QWD3_9BACT|nr:nickel-dependent hydrogenase large subunit [Sulfurovum zhangzhouensis]MDM5271135.1 nickel-dependent hydrogenase large subunit [Sulfurovum zhangzhouensis]